MVPKRDQCYRYEAKPEVFVSYVVALKPGKKAITGQFIRKWSGQKL